MRFRRRNSNLPVARRGTLRPAGSFAQFGPPSTKPMNLTGVRRNLGPVVHAIIATDLSDPKPVVLEDAVAALRLRLPMVRVRPPALHRLLVPPERQREDLARIG